MVSCVLCLLSTDEVAKKFVDLPDGHFSQLEPLADMGRFNHSDIP